MLLWLPIMHAAAIPDDWSHCGGTEAEVAITRLLADADGDESGEALSLAREASRTESEPRRRARLLQMTASLEVEHARPLADRAAAEAIDDKVRPMFRDAVALMHKAGDWEGERAAAINLCAWTTIRQDIDRPLICGPDGAMWWRVAPGALVAVIDAFAIPSIRPYNSVHVTGLGAGGVAMATLGFRWASEHKEGVWAPADARNSLLAPAATVVERRLEDATLLMEAGAAALETEFGARCPLNVAPLMIRATASLHRKDVDGAWRLLVAARDQAEASAQLEIVQQIDQLEAILPPSVFAEGVAKPDGRDELGQALARLDDLRDAGPRATEPVRGWLRTHPADPRADEVRVRLAQALLAADLPGARPLLAEIQDPDAFQLAPLQGAEAWRDGHPVDAWEIWLEDDSDSPSHARTRWNWMSAMLLSGSQLPPDAPSDLLDVALQRRAHSSSFQASRYAAFRAALPAQYADLYASWLRALWDLAPELGGSSEPVSLASRLVELRHMEERLASQVMGVIPGFDAPTTDALRAALQPDAAVVLLDTWDNPKVFGESHYSACILTGDELHWVDLGPVAAANEAISRLRDAFVLYSPQLAHAVPTDGAEVQSILRPVLDALPDRARVVHWFPVGPWAEVPMALAAPGRASVLEHDPRYFASRSLVKPLARSPAVVLANPRPSGASGTQVLDTDLSGAAREAEAIVKAFPDARTILGPSASADALRSVRGPRLLVIAAHGRNEGGSDASARLTSWVPDPLLGSALLLTDASAPGGMRWVSGVELASLDLDGTDLVVLSACESGLGTSEGAEGARGLVAAILGAGARSVIASLWRVDDASTAMLMETLHHELASGAAREDALARAQAKVASDPRYAHPWHWAGFVLWGERGPLGQRTAPAPLPAVAGRPRVLKEAWSAPAAPPQVTSMFGEAFLVPGAEYAVGAQLIAESSDDALVVRAADDGRQLTSWPLSAEHIAVRGGWVCASASTDWGCQLVLGTAPVGVVPFVHDGTLYGANTGQHDIAWAQPVGDVVPEVWITDAGATLLVQDEVVAFDVLSGEVARRVPVKSEHILRLRGALDHRVLLETFGEAEVWVVDLDSGTLVRHKAAASDGEDVRAALVPGGLVTADLTWLTFYQGGVSKWQVRADARGGPWFDGEAVWVVDDDGVVSIWDLNGRQLASLATGIAWESHVEATFGRAGLLIADGQELRLLVAP